MTQTASKTSLHPRNLHRARYDFAQLIASCPELAAFVSLNKYGSESIDFSDPAAVKALNRALLIRHYQIKEWDIPVQYLCPPIPGRADYIHYLADLLTESNGGEIPRGGSVHVLDIGVGANCIYPLIGNASYGWHFVGTDVDKAALDNAQRIVEANKLSDAIELRLQPSTADIFSGVTYVDEYFALTLSNPPFHSSLVEASQGSQRKWRNLGKAHGKQKQPLLNFGGQSLELCCEGGEAAFITRMIEESADGGDHCLWFTTLVSKSSSLPQAYSALKHFGAVDSRTIEMAQGQKKSRLLAWSFMDGKQRKAWWERHGKN